ncbi:MAG TPA: hypothetical protein VIE88_17410, partial [Vicinamibacteria bacterium]
MDIAGCGSFQDGRESTELVLAPHQLWRHERGHIGGALGHCPLGALNGPAQRLAVRVSLPRIGGYEPVQEIEELAVDVPFT